MDATQGLDAIPTKLVGESCESWTECLGRYCAPDGVGGGYCSELCGSDADCVTEGGMEGLVCTEQLLMPRPDPAHSGITHRCFLQETCLSCEVDTDCGGDHVCMNMGAFGSLTDYRCGAPCETNDDCPDPVHSCVIDIGGDGAPTGQSACMPNSCVCYSCPNDAETCPDAQPGAPLHFPPGIPLGWPQAPPATRISSSL